MTRDRIRGFCPRCRHQQVFERTQVHHGVHLFLSIVTFGLWLVSWIAIYVGHRFHPWRCVQCNWSRPVSMRQNQCRTRSVASRNRMGSRASRCLRRDDSGVSLSPVRLFLAPEVLLQHQLGALFLQVVVHLVERAADEVDAEASGLHEIERTALEFFRLRLHSEIAQPEANAGVDLFADQADELVRFVMVGVADDVRGRPRPGRARSNPSPCR